MSVSIDRDRLVDWASKAIAIPSFTGSEEELARSIRDGSVPDSVDSELPGSTTSALTAGFDAIGRRERPASVPPVHPESIATEHGHALLANFLRIAGIKVVERA